MGGDRGGLLLYVNMGEIGVACYCMLTWGDRGLLLYVNMGEDRAWLLYVNMGEIGVACYCMLTWGIGVAC